MTPLVPEGQASESVKPERPDTAGDDAMDVSTLDAPGALMSGAAALRINGAQGDQAAADAVPGQAEAEDIKPAFLGGFFSFPWFWQS